MNNPIPFNRSYWVVPGKLLAGYYPGDKDRSRAREKVQALVEAGIRHIVNLIDMDHECDECGRSFVPYGELISQLAPVSLAAFPVRDGAVPTRETMCAILDDIDAAHAQGKPVYVHCWGGKGRTGTVVGCYLARHGIAIGQAALAQIQVLRQNDPKAADLSPETDAQRELVLCWQAGQ